MPAPSTTGAYWCKMAMIRAETSPYFRCEPRTNTVAGRPRRRAASASRQAVEMGMAEWMP